jgi:hypothetical protein
MSEGWTHTLDSCLPNVWTKQSPDTTPNASKYNSICKLDLKV